MSGQRLGRLTEPVPAAAAPAAAAAPTPPGRPRAPPAPDGAREAAAAPRPASRAHSHPTVMCSAARPARPSASLSALRSLPHSSLSSVSYFSPLSLSSSLHLSASGLDSALSLPLRWSPAGRAHQPLSPAEDTVPEVTTRPPRSAQTERAHLEAERLARHAVVDRQEVLEGQLTEVERTHLEHSPAGTAAGLSKRGHTVSRTRTHTDTSERHRHTRIHRLRHKDTHGHNVSETRTHTDTPLARHEHTRTHLQRDTDKHGHTLSET